MDKNNPLVLLALSFAPLSLTAVGGGMSIVADIQRITVANGWFTPQGFIEIFAISRAAPGPGTLIVTLIGWHVAGLAGAIIASIAIFLPSSLLIYVVARIWHSRPPAIWQQAVAFGLAPIAAGLVLTSAVFVLANSNGQLSGWLVACMTAILSIRTRLGPLTLLGIGAAAYVLIEQIPI